MALTLGQKSVRVLRFLRGVGNGRIAGALAAYGFSQQDVDEGWQLLRESTGTRLGTARPQPIDPTLYERLDAWENHWFPVAQASLGRRYPEVAEKLFLNLSQTSGVEVAVSVGTFVERLRELEANPQSLEGLAEQAPAARELLHLRGLTDATLQEAEELLRQVGTIREVPAPEPDPAVLQAAEDALWGWYLEWSTIARGAISNRNQLRALGFLQSSGSSSDSDGIAPEVLAEEAEELLLQPSASA